MIDNTSLSPRTIAVATGGEVVGDGMVKLPLVLALRRALPDAKITWLTPDESAYQGVLASLIGGAINDFIVHPRPSLRLGSLFGKSLFNEPFDVLIDTQGEVKRAVWLKKRVPHRVFVSPAMDARLSSVKVSSRVANEPNLIERLIGLAEAALGQPLERPDITFPDPKWEKAAAELLPDGKKYVGLIPGAGLATKIWPQERFIQMGRRLAEKGFTPVVILGPNEVDLGPVLASSLPMAEFPLRNAPFNDVPMTLALIRRMEATLANDSGGGNIALAANRPSVVIYRKATVRNKYAPVRQNVIALAPEDFGGTIIRDITSAHVGKALGDLLGTQLQD